MPQHLALGILAVAALGAIGLTVYFWRKSTGLYALLVEGANRFEDLRARNTKLEQAVLKGEEKVKAHRDTALRLEKAIAESRDKGAELVRKLETKDAESKFISEKLELQKGFLEKQLAKAQEQLRISEEQRDALKVERDDLQKKHARIATESERALQLARQEAQLRERDLITKSRDLEKTVETTKKKFEAVDPIEIKKVRRKIAQYDRLYSSMKGLREMTEERNRNYEVALRKLSAWIVTKTQGNARLPDGIGPLVGRALEIIGAQLIDDSESLPRTTRPEAGATRADSMDDLIDTESGETIGGLALGTSAEHMRLARETDAEAAALEAEKDAEAGRRS